jgi:hypothetical protein
MPAACPLCGASLDLEGGHVPRKEACPACGQDLHACQACRLFAPTAHNQCREPRAEWQSRRDKANYCDFFELAEGPAEAAESADKEAERKRQLDDLFRNL